MASVTAISVVKETASTNVFTPVSGSLMEATPSMDSVATRETKISKHDKYLVCLGNNVKLLLG